MKFSANKTIATMIAIFLVLTITASLALPIANAHTPAWTIQTYAYVVAAPNPVGVGESVFIVVWIHGAPPTAAGLAGDRWRGYTIKVTKPNGDVENLGTWDSDPIGNAYTTYTPDQIGTYKIDFNFPGQTLSQTGPTGLLGSYSDFINDTYSASSATTYLEVQQEQIAKIPQYPLPSEYWTRPIEGQNSAWASVASNWLSGAQLSSGYSLWQTDGVAPDSPHVMWTKPIELGGIVGGDSDIPGVGFYSGGSYEGRFWNAIIMSGRLYFVQPLGHSSGDRSSGLGYACLDLRTGEEIWFSDTIGVPYMGVYGTDRPTMKGELFNYESQNQHGVVGGLIWQVSGTTWIAYDAFSGHWMYNLTNVPSGTEVYTRKGEIVRYVLNYNAKTHSGWLALWNNTQHNVGLELSADMTSTNAYQWRPIGKTVDMSTAYSWNVTITADLSGSSAPAIVQVIPGDIILGRSSAIAAGVGDKYTPDPYTIWAISDKPATRGQLLWIKNYPAPTGNLTRRFATANPIDTVNRVFFMADVENMNWLGYSLDTGELKWGPVTGAERSYSYYGSGEGGGQRGVAAYGNVYVQGFGGELICYSGKNGTMLWKYNSTNSGDETPWGYYPIFVGVVADGKVYAFNNEHSPNYPLYKGEKVRCINATTGEEIWTLLGWSGQQGGPGSSTMIEAEGFLTYYNYYDNQIYCIGKGPSATTVAAPMTAITAGDTVILQGTVTDIAAGTKQNEQAARFPSGVPAVSDASMEQWMEYVYMQKPRPTNATGVEVTLDALDPNNNFVHLGTATSDTSGLFSCAWTTPDVPGKYTVVATFAGSNSYWGSYAETAMYVQEMPQPTAAPQYPQPIDPTMTIVAMGIAIIIVVAIVGVLILRKK